MEESVKAEEASLSGKRSCSFSFYSPKFLIFLLIILVGTLVLLQLQALKFPLSAPSSSSSSWGFFQQLGQRVFNSSLTWNCTQEVKAMASKLRDAVTFLPLKDLRFASSAVKGHTWFMSSLNDTFQEGEAEYLYFPSNASMGRLLCLMGRDPSDGGKNSYALAWKATLPRGAKLLDGLTYVSDTYYDYDNIWHGLSAMLPFVWWHKTRGCVVPARWVLYHWGELREEMGVWVRTLMEATFGRGGLQIETLHRPTCFETALVFRHNQGSLGKERRLEVFDMLRCKGREYCNVSQGGAAVGEGGRPIVRLTLLLRTGGRSFKNEIEVEGIFERVCQRVGDCSIKVAHSNNLTFCDQVRLMSSTDILVSPHGAQLTNMFFMNKNSSVMEFFPKGWLELAGVGQYVYHWLASWSGMRHQGAWRDPQGDDCPLPYSVHDDCFSFYKNAKLGHNETYFASWTMDVLEEVKKRKVDETLGVPTDQSMASKNRCQYCN